MAAGANGTSAECAVTRHANNLESVVTYEGAVELPTLVVGKALAGLSTFRWPGSTRRSSAELI